ncbi:DUF4328 domain-containing protein [Streptomyces blastmyceticus]|uniref:DUF4328 domain-containing protein n=1 Tax=Streptomyces blastmyceticus TaxID=68180 RepID=A0ABP3G6H1_9ACTN
MYPCGRCRAAAVGPDGRCAACGAYQQQPAPPMGMPPAPPYPYAAAMPVGAADLRRGLRIALSVLLSVSVVALLCLFWARTEQRSAIQAVIDDGVGGSAVNDAEDADGYVAAAQLFYFLMLAVTSALWAVWFRRARLNAELFAPGTHRMGTGWAAGAWFTPVVNLWFPKQIVNDIYRASAPAGPQSAPKGLLNTWWSLWIGSFALNAVSFVMAAAAGARLRSRGYDGSSWHDDVDALKSAANLAGFSALLTAAAGVLAIFVVRQLARLQEQRALMGPAPMGPPMGAMGPMGPMGVPVPGQMGGPAAGPMAGPVAGGWGNPPHPPHPSQNPYGNGPAGY